MTDQPEIAFGSRKKRRDVVSLYIDDLPPVIVCPSCGREHDPVKMIASALGYMIEVGDDRIKRAGLALTADCWCGLPRCGRLWIWRP